MAKPETEDHYLANMIPASVSAVSRRNVLKGAGAVGAAVALPSVRAACGSSDSAADGSTGGASASPTGTVTFGSNEAGGDVPQMRREAQAAAYTAASGVEVTLNSVDHNGFQENINNYLESGNADDVFSWFAGYRLQVLAAKGLVGDISDIFPMVGINEAFTKSGTGADGKQYFVPESNYPWAMFYRMSFWEDRGYEVPTSYDQLITLSKKMAKDGLNPIAFADKDGWPAMGTFDIINMRTNGYAFHTELMAGERAWDSPEVKNVFNTWKEILEYSQPDSLGRTWQEAGQSLVKNESGMYLLGLFVSDQFPVKEIDDVGFFTFPEIDPAIGADAIDAPIDGYCMSADPKNVAGAKGFLSFLGSAAGADAVSNAGEGYAKIWANSDADQSKYPPINVRAAAFIAEQKSIAQFLDRDTRPDFAATVVIPSFQAFIKNPNDIDAITKSMQSQAVSIFAG